MSQHTIAYILKGFPRNSEAFITNEVHALEALGFRFKIFSAFPGEATVSMVAQNIQSPVMYLPEDPSTIDSSFWSWLKANVPRYAFAHFHLFRQQPVRYVKVLIEAIRLSFSLRRTWGFEPKKAMYKEFLRAGYIADQVLKSKSIRHLHAHFCHGATTMAMFASSLTGIPFSFTAHAKDIYLPKLNPGNLLSIKLRRTTFVATCTEFNQEHLQRLYPHDSAKVHRVYHGVDTERFLPASVQHSDIPLILSVGRHVKKKGFTYLIQACGILRDRGHQFQCVILGESDEDTSQISQFIRSLDLETIITLEPGVSQDDLRQIYHRATIFALACHIVDSGDRDGIPNVLAEAMAAEIPVVSTAISGIPELITDRHNGLLVPQKNPNALADALEELLMNPTLRTELTKAGRERILQIFDARSNIKALAHLFQCAHSDDFDSTPIASVDSFTSAHRPFSPPTSMPQSVRSADQPDSSDHLGSHNKLTVPS